MKSTKIVHVYNRLKIFDQFLYLFTLCESIFLFRMSDHTGLG